MITGCYSEYFTMPASNVWVHRYPISTDVASIFDPFGNAVHTALQFPCLGEDVLVSGAGPIGLMAALVVKHAGARNVVVSDLSPERLELARSLGIETTVNPREQKLTDIFDHISMHEGYDVGLEMSGSGKALADMIGAMNHGGRIALLGTPPNEISIDFATIIFNMLTLQGVTGRQIFETWYAMSVLIQAGLDISGVITDKFHYTDYKQAFATAANGKGGKVIMTWDEE
ncbi:50S ribosomal protein L14 [Platysternon megacephalum]|uniref:50S ribosomal protein L14 n=1 Tax=Platysternon megacephalum TaxID=55544 RepID=A0A4D9DCZ4_9SAUR|nr:50S ribosomal protein L14 [Platysternon megacephalum]